MNDDFPDARLDAALRTLRDQSQSMETPRAVEAALLAAFAQHYPAKRPRGWWRRFTHPWRASLGAAAMVTLLVLTLPSDRSASMQSPVTLDDGGDFFALTSTEDIAREPAPQLVETEVPLATLAGLGVSLSPDNAGDLVRAQFLVGADGRPLALRLLPAVSTPPPDRG